MSQPAIDKLTKAELLVLVGLWQPMDPWRIAMDMMQARIAVASQRHGTKVAQMSETLAAYLDAGASCDTAATAAAAAVGSADYEETWRKYQRARSARDEARALHDATVAAAETAWSKLERLWAEQDALWHAQSSITGKSATAEDAAPMEDQ